LNFGDDQVLVEFVVGDIEIGDDGGFICAYNLINSPVSICGRACGANAIQVVENAIFKFRVVVTHRFPTLKLMDSRGVEMFLDYPFLGATSPRPEEGA
jgi:hypothetical protein